MKSPWHTLGASAAPAVLSNLWIDMAELHCRSPNLALVVLFISNHSFCSCFSVTW